MHENLHIHSTGEGPDVVLLHGTPMDPGEFVELSLPNVRAHVVHLPGYGASAAARDLDLDAVERAIVASLAALGIARPILLGASSGAYRALSLVLSERVNACALLLVGGFAGLAAPHRLGLRDLADALDAGADMSDALGGASFSPSYSRSHPEPAARSVARALGAATPATIAGDLRAVAGSPDLTERLRPLDIPVSIVVGEEDAATPPAYSEVLAAGLRVDVQRIASAGHALHIERPDVWRDLVASLVQRSTRG